MRETIGWKRELHELAGETDRTLLDSWRSLQLSVAKEIMVAVANGGFAPLDRHLVCPGANVIRGTLDVPALIVLHGGNYFLASAINC
jgi:hypothetical protein